MIQVVARQDSNGMTFAFNNHHAEIGQAWAEGPGVGELKDWSGGPMIARGNDGVAGRIKITEVAIGYVEAGFAERLRLPLASLEDHRNGGRVAPNVENGQRTLAGGSDAVPDDLAAVVTDPEGAGPYPIVTCTWALPRGRYADPTKAEAVDSMIRWPLTDGPSWPVPDAPAVSAAAVPSSSGL